MDREKEGGREGCEEMINLQSIAASGQRQLDRSEDEQQHHRRRDGVVNRTPVRGCGGPAAGGCVSRARETRRCDEDPSEVSLGASGA